MTRNEAVARSVTPPHGRPWVDDGVTGGRPGSVALAFVELPGGESAAERRSRLGELQAAALRLSLSGDHQGEISVELPCEVELEQARDLGRAVDVPAAPAWLVVRVEAYEPIQVGGTALTALSVAVPEHVGPGRYELAELRRRAVDDVVEWWEIDDFHLSPGPQGGDGTFYLDVDAIDDAHVTLADGSVEFDLPMASTVSEVRVRGSIAWGRSGGRVVPISRAR